MYITDFVVDPYERDREDDRGYTPPRPVRRSPLRTVDRELYANADSGWHIHRLGLGYTEGPAEAPPEYRYPALRATKRALDMSVLH